jgi:hypothetical protein
MGDIVVATKTEKIPWCDWCKRVLRSCSCAGNQGGRTISKLLQRSTGGSHGAHGLKQKVARKPMGDKERFPDGKYKTPTAP